MLSDTQHEDRRFKKDSKQYWEVEKFYSSTFFLCRQYHSEFQWRPLRNIDGSLSLLKNVLKNVTVHLLPMAVNDWC